MVVNVLPRIVLFQVTLAVTAPAKTSHGQLSLEPLPVLPAFDLIDVVAGSVVLAGLVVARSDELFDYVSHFLLGGQGQAGHS